MPARYDRLRASGDSHETLLEKDKELLHQRWWSKERLIIAVETTIIGLLLVAIVIISLPSGSLSTPKRSFATDFGMEYSVLAKEVFRILTVSRQPWRRYSVQTANIYQSITAYL